MNRVFSGADYPFQAAYPAVNIWVNENGGVVTAELPGVDVNKIDISVLGDTLTISGRRDTEVLKENESYHRKERNGSKFSRTLQLPFKINEKGIEARYEKGILMMTLSREEAEKPKKITIKAM
jgi:HSP20 family protein